MTETTIKTTIEPDLDEGLLEEAQRQLGGTSRGEALNTALRRLVEQERARRRRALERTQHMADEGLLDFSKLDDVDL